MKKWTHWVFCEETKLVWHSGKYLAVKAVQDNGVWRLCERNIPGTEYGMKLSVVASISKEEWEQCPPWAPWVSKMIWS